MDPTVTNFFTKNAEANYLAEYDHSHGPRLDAMINHFNLGNLKNQRIVDVGGGLGFLGKRLDPSNDYWVIDGADVLPEQQLCKGQWINTDLDHSSFGSYSTLVVEQVSGDGIASHTVQMSQFDVAFFLETLEHIGNPHHALVEIKKLVKPNGNILISIPTENVWHNAPYPSLLWPQSNFVQFLEQMALPVVESWEYQPKTVGWPAYHFMCRNEAWSNKKLLFPKAETKFHDATPLQCTNL